MGTGLAFLILVGFLTSAARGWRFLPGRRVGPPVPTVAYLVFGFPEPVVSAGPG